MIINIKLDISLIFPAERVAEALAEVKAAEDCPPGINTATDLAEHMIREIAKQMNEDDDAPGKAIINSLEVSEQQ